MRLIDADALLEDLKITGYNPDECEEDSTAKAWAKGFIAGIAHAIHDVIHKPTIEAAPVVHGEWLNFYGDYSTAECDQCAQSYEVSPDEEPKKEWFEVFRQCYKFCPNCGAKMTKQNVSFCGEEPNVFLDCAKMDGKAVQNER